MRRARMRRITSKVPSQNHRGQAVVEYLLMLIVAVALIGGALYQFNDAFRKYLQGYFGEYLACLLETGELPRLGHEESDSLCDDFFEPFDFAKGRPLKKSADEGGQGKTEEARERSDGPASAGEQSSRGGSGGSGTGFQKASDYERKQMGGEEDQRKGSEKELGFMDVGGSRGSTSGGWGRRHSVVDGKLTAAYLKQKKAKEASKDQSLEVEGDGRARQVVKVPLNNEKKETVEEEDPFDLGNLFRYLVIAAIIIAIVIFLGGQAMQISKSWE